MKVGILALQGAVQPHETKFRELGIETVQVRVAKDLDNLRGIILPGGESSAIIHLLKLNALWNPLMEFTATHATWGICAGAILLAKKVSNPSQVSLNQIDIEITRNAYGRQSESFISDLEPTSHWKKDSPFEGVFIRAPRINTTGPEVRTLFSFKSEPVMVEDRHLLVSTFHPELTNSTTVHEYFLNKCQK